MSVHLYIRSCYTLLESSLTIPKLMQKTKEYGYQYAALTDHNVMYGIPSFLHACHDNGISPIIGMEADIQYHEQCIPFLLLAKDNLGYAQLMKLSSLLNHEPKKAGLDELNACADHCFIIAYGEGGFLDSDLIKEDKKACMQKLRIMKEEIAAFDMALSYQESAMWKKRNAFLKQACMNLHISTCALNKISYLNQTDNAEVQILQGIRQNKTLHDSSLLLPTGRYFLSPEEMAALYEEDDLQRTEEIAKECHADGNIAKASLPHYHVPIENVSSKEYLEALCTAGLKKRLSGKKDERYQKRLAYELQVITQMHFEDYFLIVYDFICYARKHDINVGPGRGSAAGSLAAYCLGITMIDPIKYDLLFERFLNPERISMPDIDTDIPDDHRQEVIQYVCDTYGSDYIANIVTFNTLGAKQAIHDVGKVMNLNESDINLVLRQIHGGAKTSLKQAYLSSPNLKQIVGSNDKIHRLYAMALRLEGLPRHTGIHAAGIIMSSKPLNDVIPTIQDGAGMKTSQYPMEYLEERGLIKMDFLGLKNLRIIHDISAQVKKADPSFSLNTIPLQDADVYRMFAAADTTGIFQFESEGMKPFLRRMHPVCFNDIVAANALYRPGPMENISVYLANKEHPEKIQYPSKEMREILEDTYGVMIYQEQVMLALQKAGGFSLGRADILRRAISKKKSDVMAKMKPEFIHGCRQNQYSEETAEKLFSYIEKFSGYGFNKSHSVAYSLIAYQMAYLKVKYPMYFYSALLDSVIGDKEKTSQYVDECRRRGIKVLYPDVNASALGYDGSQNAIRLPLSAVNEIGFNLNAALIKERESNGAYQDFFDFTARASVLKMKRDQIESLIDAGALDCFHMGRATCRHALDDALRYGELVQIHNGTQISINLGLVSKPEVIRIKEDEMIFSENERNALGFNLGPHPIIVIRRENNIKDPSLAWLKNKVGRYNGFALISSVKQHRTKRGEMMAFISLSDETGQADMAVMPRLYQKKADVLVRGMYIRFNAKIEEGKSFLANDIQEIRKKAYDKNTNR